MKIVLAIASILLGIFSVYFMCVDIANNNIPSAILMGFIALFNFGYNLPKSLEL
jgi:hypothetical protein